MVESEVIGWKGLVLPYGAQNPVGDQSVVYRSGISQPYRYLPLPVKVQYVSADGHKNAVHGLSNITRVWQTPEGLWASGPIDTDYPDGQRLAQKIRGGYVGWVSADIETDGGEIINTGQGRCRGYSRWRLTGVTLVADPAFEAARVVAVTDPSEITSVDEARAGARDLVGAAFSLSEVVTFVVGTPVKFTVVGDIDLPWASRDHAWDGPGASRRVQEWADGDTDRMSQAFLWRNPERDPTTQAAYSLGYADVIDGRLRAVYRGLAAASGRLGQTENGMTAADRERVAARISTLYERAAAAFDDPTIMERGENMSGDSIEEKFQTEEIISVDVPDRDTFRLSDEDVTRIAEATASAVVALQTEQDTMAQAEFARLQGVMGALGVGD